MWKKAYEMLRPAGMLVGFGFSNAISGSTRNMFRVVKQFLQIPKYTPLQLMDTNRAVAGVNLGHLWDEQDMLLGQLRDILRLWEEGKVKPHIDKVYTFAEAAEAHRRIEDLLTGVAAKSASQRQRCQALWPFAKSSQSRSLSRARASRARFT